MKQIKAASIMVLLEQEAAKIFDNYPEIEEIYMTADKQGFTEKTKAENQAAYLKDKKVHYFIRSKPTAEIKAETNDEETGDDTGDKETSKKIKSS
ncbi:hypothetical protein [Riemerella columbipharyngis]|nr:hypothetical protein [Riemerella columbipharyngis]